MDDPALINRRISLVAMAAALYSAFVVGFFAISMARNFQQPISDAAKPLLVFGFLAVLPYVLAWVAQKLSASTRGSKVTLVVVSICAATTVLFYLPGFNPAQDSYFVAIFATLGIAQALLIGACIAYVLWQRKVGI